MKTIYKSCYFYYCYCLLVFGSEYCYGTVLDKFQDSQPKCKCTGTVNGVSTDFDGNSNCQMWKDNIVFLTLVYKFHC
jgi:hypothetical protein